MAHSVKCFLFKQENWVQSLATMQKHHRPIIPISRGRDRRKEAVSKNKVEHNWERHPALTSDLYTLAHVHTHAPMHLCTYLSIYKQEEKFEDIDPQREIQGKGNLGIRMTSLQMKECQRLLVVVWLFLGRQTDVSSLQVRCHRQTQVTTTSQSLT